MSKPKGRMYIECPTHSSKTRYLRYGEKTCIKRLYFKPNNKLKSIENLWICEKSGNIFLSDGSRGSQSWTEKKLETNLSNIGKVPNWYESFPDIASFMDSE